MAERADDNPPSTPQVFANTTPPTELSAGGEMRMVVRDMAALNAKFDNLTKPPAFRTADILALAGAIVALAVFVMSSFALSDRIAQSEARLATMQERIADDVSSVSRDVSTLQADVAVMEERTKKP